MSSTSPGKIFANVKAEGTVIFRRLIQPHTTSFNLIVLAVAGAVTTAFAVVILLMILVATNCNILGAVE
jgi:hypothetical protein